MECNQGRKAKPHERESSNTGDTYAVAVMCRNTLDLLSGERNHCTCVKWGIAPSHLHVRTQAIHMTLHHFLNIGWNLICAGLSTYAILLGFCDPNCTWHYTYQSLIQGDSNHTHSLKIIHLRFLGQR